MDLFLDNLSNAMNDKQINNKTKDKWIELIHRNLLCDLLSYLNLDEKYDIVNLMEYDVSNTDFYQSLINDILDKFRILRTNK